MANKLKLIYCRTCKRTTNHEDEGVDVKPTHRYVCIECLSCNPLPLCESSNNEPTTKMLVMENINEETTNK